MTQPNQSTINQVYADNPQSPIWKPNINVPVNDDMLVTYSHFKNDFVFERPGALEWFSQPAKAWQEPTNNSFVSTVRQAGVDFCVFEHVSVVLCGNIEYVFTTNTNSRFGFSGELGCNLGSNNVDNGLGYIPAATWSRTFRNNCRTACVLFKPDRNTNTEYRFSVIKDIENYQPSTQLEFAHVCSGSAVSDQQTYTTQQNINNLTDNTQITLGENTVLIVGWKV